MLDDPAFSPDPRSHPHFPLANARSYKAVPSKSPRPSSPLPDGPPSPSSSPPLSSDSDSLSSPALSSATSHSPSPVPSPAPSTPLSPLSTQPNLISKPSPQRPPLPVPEILPKPHPLTRRALKTVPTNIPPKSRMKAFVRRLTTRHNLDRIDELDETDPFGGSYHHGGPYEAIGSSLAQPTLPRMSSNTAPRRGSIHPPRRESVPHPLRPGQHQFAYRVPSAYGETGLSLHLEPGQILQQNPIYSFHASSIATVPDQFRPQLNTVSTTTRPDHSRRQSLPNPRTRSREYPSSLDLRDRDSLQNPQSSSLRAPRERYLGDYTPDNSPPLHHDHNAAPYVHQSEKTVFPPPRYEPRLHSSGPPRLPQRTPPPSFHPTSPKTQPMESAVVALPCHNSRHKSVHSLDSSYTTNSKITQSSYTIQNNPLDPPRIRHLPKRLVMPALLQPQSPQLQYNFPPAEPPAWQHEYPDDHALEGAHFQGKPAMCSPEPRLLRKKSSAFPAKSPIPDHVLMSQDDALPIMGNSPTKTVNEAEGTRERTRRRKLSKRKSDI